ncbi:MAG: hypothetical protein F6K19_51050 [Cyanothece sp. SIO1E1]|nr:hypothetical protein [Cyanothece sp. SIO1E1]
MKAGISLLEWSRKLPLQLSISFWLWILFPLGLKANGWLIVDVEINNQPVPFLFDTGTGETLLFRKSADRLDLEVEAPPPDANQAPGEVLLGKTEKCQFTLGGVTYETRLGVFDLPSPTVRRFRCAAGRAGRRAG